MNIQYVGSEYIKVSALRQNDTKICNLIMMKPLIVMKVVYIDIYINLVLYCDIYIHLFVYWKMYIFCVTNCSIN